MDNLVSILAPILIGGLKVFVGLLALVVSIAAITSVAAVYQMTDEVQSLRQEVFDLRLSHYRTRDRLAKKRTYRRRKQTARPSTRRVKDKRATGEEPAQLD